MGEAPGVRRLPARLYDFWWGTGLADDVPALTYYLVLSLAPFALGVAAILALLLEDYVSALEVADQINRYLPEEIHGDVTQLITSSRSGSPVLLLIAIVAMLWTTSGAIGVVERVTSRILDAPRHHIVIGRLRNMALGAMVAILVVLAAGGATVVAGVTDIAGVASTLPSWVIVALNAAGAVLLCAAIYRLAPLGRLHWRAALLGALPAGVALQLIPNLVGLYVAQSAGFQAVRLFFVLVAVLIGLYAMATVILVGAGIAAKRELALLALDNAPAPRRAGRTWLTRARRASTEP
jgi:YihY family inner membrane protein